MVEVALNLLSPVLVLDMEAAGTSASVEVVKLLISMLDHEDLGRSLCTMRRIRRAKIAAFADVPNLQTRTEEPPNTNHTSSSPDQQAQTQAVPQGFRIHTNRTV